MAEVDDLAQQRKQYFDEASKAHDAGDGKKAKEMSDKGKEAGRMMEAAILKAGYLIYEGKSVQMRCLVQFSIGTLIMLKMLWTYTACK